MSDANSALQLSDLTVNVYAFTGSPLNVHVSLTLAFSLVLLSSINPLYLAV